MGEVLIRSLVGGTVVRLGVLLTPGGDLVRFNEDTTVFDPG
jgi:hypothetical protein